MLRCEMFATIGYDRGVNLMFGVMIIWWEL